jgi:PAS domain S-box-containing protein
MSAEATSGETVSSGQSNLEGQGAVLRPQAVAGPADKRLKLQFDAMPIACISSNSELQITAWNPAAEKIFGYTAQEVLGKDLRLLVPEDLVPHLSDVWQRLLESHGSVHSVNKNKTRDGRIITCDWTNTLLRTEAGECVGVLSMATDITERQRAEDELRASQQRYRDLINLSPDAIFVIRDDRIALLNPAALDLFGATQEEQLLGKCVVEVFHPDHHTQVRERIELLRQAKAVPRIEEKVVRLDGGVRDVESAAALFTDQEVLAIQFILRDVTERKRAEAELAHARDLLDTLLDNLPDAIYFKDLQSRFLRVSKSKLQKSFDVARKLHLASGASAAAPDLPPHLVSLDAFAQYLIGKSDFDFIAEEHARPVYEAEQEVIRTGKPILGKIEQVTQRDGTIRWVLSAKMRWCDKKGNPIGIFGTSKDITSIKETEANLERVHRQLVEASRQAGMAEVATGVLHNVGNVLNSVNVSAGLVLQQLMNSRGDGVARVAQVLQKHRENLADFLSNDPQGRQVPTYLERLSERLESERNHLLEEVKTLMHNVEHIKAIVAMQQEYARASGVLEQVSPSDLVEDAIKINADEYARRGLSVVRQFESLPLILVDKHKALQILVNLLNNAMHASQHDKEGQQVIARLKACGNDRLQFEVVDHGIGIAPENLSRIFSQGFTTRENGHGFGLHTGALAAREMGGCLTVHSEGLGCGATFRLELPLAAAAGNSSG